MNKTKGIKRRRFIKQSILGLIGGGVLSKGVLANSNIPRYDNSEDMPRIKEFRILGRTGFKVSDIGAGDFDDPGPFKALLDA